MDIDTLQDMAAWARARVVSGEEPPWTFQKLKSLNEICAELAAGMSATSASFPVQDFTQRESVPGQDLPMTDDQKPEAQILVLDSFRSRREPRQSLSLPT